MKFNISGFNSLVYYLHFRSPYLRTMKINVIVGQIVLSCLIIYEMSLLLKIEYFFRAIYFIFCRCTHPYQYDGNQCACQNQISSTGFLIFYSHTFLRFPII